MMWSLEKKFVFYKKVSIFVAGIFLFQIFFPTAAWALTGGSSQTEYSSFEPVATTQMVNDFSGDFTYNLPVLEIPGPNGGGYPLSLSYHSGSSPEEEASWVGYGWSLNPGAINRVKRGFPDDYNGEDVKYWNTVPANRTVSVTGPIGLEVFSQAIPLGTISATLRYNNYKGFGYSVGRTMYIGDGLVTLGFGVTNGQGNFSASINPGAILNYIDRGQKEDGNDAASKKSDSKKGRLADFVSRLKGFGRNLKDSRVLRTALGSTYGIVSHNFTIRSQGITKYSGGSVDFAASVQGTPVPAQIGLDLSMRASYTWQENVNSSNQTGQANALSGYGYMYSSEAPTNGSGIMDYYTERLNPYDKQDRYLGIPFSNADNFLVSGEGIGGGFRVHNKKAGHFYPNTVSSKIDIVNVGGEVELGLDIGGGGHLGIGMQKLTSGHWHDATVTSGQFVDSSSGGDEYNFFRFTNDLGGKVDYGNDDLQRALINYSSGSRGNKSFIPSVSHIPTSLNEGSRSQRSSYISYHTNKEMGYAVNGINYKSYSQDPDIDDNITRSTVADGIGEFAIYNEDGMRYTYGLPVYSRNELNMRYGLQGVAASSIDNNYLAYRSISSGLKIKVGEERDAAYATTYLLTEIASPDYVDRTMDGPTDDDFGGYTRFSYDRIYGTDDKSSPASAWYQWRIPYTGLLYNRGELSTQKDDVGTVMTGEKEIYYLDTIETKTHYAVFHVSARSDSYSAAENEGAAASRTEKGTATLRKLDRIELYSKNGGSPQMIKTVRFAYDYSRCDNLPNGKNGTTGKLTLTKVWFEYDGIYNATISPYVFEYEYPSTTYPDKYGTLDNYGGSMNENPNYSAFNIDAWGNYQYGGANRFDSLRNWVNQNPNATNFDPAAWQLKVIKLPTQGEIHIQYEQDDYAFVQNQRVMAMVSLSEANSADGGKYYLNIEDMGLSSLSDELALVKRINSTFTPNGKKIYFKFLYSLVGQDSDLDKCTSEYITGYCSVIKSGRDANGVYVQLGSYSRSGKYDIPRKVCRDFVKTNRIGSLNISGNCDAEAVGIGTGTVAEQIANELIGFIGTALIPGDAELCADVNFELSYLRVPMITPKKGGGIRVKRLLMYDEGLESGDQALYGSEYTYTKIDPIDSTGVISSGVAINEPVREENALVEFDEKFRQSFLNRAVAGRDKEQAEKPLGETNLPAPSVGYSRVVISNIHTGTTNPGFAVKEFYTARDFPIEVHATTIKQEKDFFPLPAFYVNLFTNNLWLSQGFVFKHNNMHGQIRRDASYAGDPEDVPNARLSTLQEYSYFEPGELVPTMGSLNAIDMVDVGKETEVIFEIRSMEDETKKIQLEVDLDLGIFGFIPLPYFSLAPNLTRSITSLKTHVTNKVVRYPAIQKSVKTYVDGIYHLTENLAFNTQTGKPILTRSTDGFNDFNLDQSSNHNGAYLSYNFPASTQYTEMGQKAKNERVIAESDDSTVKIEKFVVDNVHTLVYTAASGYSVCDAMNLFPGDLIKLYEVGTMDDRGVYHVTDSVDGSTLLLDTTAAFGTQNASGDEVIVEVLRSGRTNQLNINTGSFTSYGDTTTFSNIDAGEMARRQALADKLDSALYASDGADSLNGSLIPEGLTYVDPVSGECISMNDSISIIDFDDYTACSAIPGGSTFRLQILDVRGDTIERCQCLTKGGHFDIDDETLDIVYYQPDNQCHGIQICIDFCPDPITTINVVQADAQTYDDHWSYSALLYDKVDGSSNYENGSRGKWRLLSNYVYLDTAKGAIDANERTYTDAGTFGLTPFDWLDTSKNDDTRWIKLNTVTSYSPNGNALEEQDVLGIYSTAKFGYDKTVPYLVANNADYQSVQFDGFEKLYGSEFEDGWDPIQINTRDTNYAHSGSASWKMTTNFIFLKEIVLTQQMLDKGVSFKAWVRDTSEINDTAIYASLYSVAPYKFDSTSFHKVARTGEWTLYEALLTNLSNSFNLGDSLFPLISPKYNASSGGTIWLDDIRFQPRDAQMVTYVYDTETLRLIASFDDQHFGLFYVYNAEGKLVRKLIETEKGVKTITETLYNTPTVQRQ